MKQFVIALFLFGIIAGCKEEKSPVSSGDQFTAGTTFENDTIAISLNIAKESYAEGDPLNAMYTITNKTNRMFTFAFDTSNIFYAIRNDSSRVIMSYPSANAKSSGSIVVAANSNVRIAINEPLHDMLNIPLRTGKYTLIVWLEEAKHRSLPLEINIL